MQDLNSKMKSGQSPNTNEHDATHVESNMKGRNERGDIDAEFPQLSPVIPTDNANMQEFGAAEQSGASNVAFLNQSTDLSRVSEGLDISNAQNETFCVDDLGIKCQLGFNAHDQEAQRILIRRNQKRPFFGNMEYQQRLRDFHQYHNNSKRLHDEASTYYTLALRETQDNLREFVSRTRTYLNGKNISNSREYMHLQPVDPTIVTP